MAINLKLQAVFAFLFIPLSIVSAEQNGKVVFELGQNLNLTKIIQNDAKIIKTNTGLRIKTGHKTDWPGITINAPDGKWDLSEYEYLTVDVKNLSPEPLLINLRIDNPKVTGQDKSMTRQIDIQPNKTRTLTMDLSLGGIYVEPFRDIFGFGSIDSSNVTRLIVFTAKPDKSHIFEISNIKAHGQSRKMTADSFFPFVDRFGQFIHKDWPGKTNSEKDFACQLEAEQKDIAANPKPSDWNKYGGWANGPQLKATGFFRTEKYNNKWFFVDPEGKLFLSVGPSTVVHNTCTPITDRQKYFKNLPEPNSPLAQFYKKSWRASRGYYADFQNYQSYSFSEVNLFRKYGPNWKTINTEHIHQRLKSWAMNTIAAWIDKDICLEKKTAYVHVVTPNAKSIGPAGKQLSRFKDPYDENLRASLRKLLEEEKVTLNNYCIGYFVDNEINWENASVIGNAIMQSSAEQPAKKALAEYLRTKYQTITKLNTSWSTNYESWDDFLNAANNVDIKKAQNDLQEFYVRLVEEYFSVCRQELKRAVPNHLYLGCRFASYNDTVVGAAAKYCDVLSFNIFHYSTADLSIPADIDKPVLIGEFHFGSVDRGLFNPGLRRAKNQQHRAELFEKYISEALSKLAIVGVHWFQYRDEPVTGRFDGENYQIGFVDVCDNPYPEIIKACRAVGRNLYSYK